MCITTNFVRIKYIINGLRNVSFHIIDISTLDSHISPRLPYQPSGIRPSYPVSETIAAYDVKLIDLMKISIEGQGHFLTLARGHLRLKIETCFSQKPLGHF